MKLFDYKFLILLGLTLVVYFMYREILDLKSKVLTIEDRVSNEIKQPNNKLNKKVNDASITYNKVESNEKPISFQIPLPPPPVKEKEKEIETQKVENNIPNLVHNMNDSEDIENLNNSGEQVAIYSNDNDKTESYSLGDSSILESSGNMEELDISNISEDINSIDTNEILNNDNLQENLSEKSTDSKKKTSMVKSEGDESIDNGIDTNHLSNLSYSEFMKYKLNELQCFAEENSINIKKLNGKKKTKSNLSTELVEHFSSKKISSL